MPPGMLDRHHGCRRHGDFISPGARDHYPPDLSLEPVHLDIALWVHLETRAVAGTVTHTVRGRAAGARTLRMHAVDFTDVSVRDADGRDLAVFYDGKELAVTWHEPFALAEERRVAITYRVVEPSTGLFFAGPDDAYPHEPRFAVTDHETERARHWLPTIDLPAVRPTLSFHLRAPSTYTIVANGRHVRDEAHDDETKTSHWELVHGCPSYLTCFIVGDFLEVEDGEVGGVPISYYATRAFTEEALRTTFGGTPKMLAWMNEKLGTPFPFPKYAQFCARGIGGAMENISLVSWDDRWVVNAETRAEMGWLVDLVNVHEMAHSWFGDLIVCRDYAHAWLKESWATYMESCWLEDEVSRESHLCRMYAAARDYFAEADERYKRPIVTRHFNTSWDMYDRHLYPGGAFRLHMLRGKLGDDSFWSGVREYIARFKGKTVETDDFRRVMEEVSGRSLVKFFDQWFYKKGYPDLKVTFAWDAEHKEGTFELEQRQAKDGNEPVFEFELELAWVIGTERTRRSVSVRTARERFAFPMAGSPDLVRVDPDGKVLIKLEFDPGEQRLLRQLTDATDVLGRIHAGSMLTRTRRQGPIAAVRDAFATEPVWEVRVQWAKALGEAQATPTLEALLTLAASHEDPRVLPRIFAALAEYRDPRVTPVVEARLDRGLLPRAAEQAYLALGAQREAAPFSRLVAASAVDGPGGFAQSGALRALAATRRPEAVPVLEERLTFGTIDRRARPAGAQALGEIARRVDRRAEEQAAESLTNLLRDPDAVTRSSAANGLAAARATRSTRALEAYRETLSDQERVHLDRLLDRLRQNADNAAARADQRIDALTDQLKSLESRVLKLEARDRGR